jgi:hypothetical protein
VPSEGRKAPTLIVPVADEEDVAVDTDEVEQGSAAALVRKRKRPPYLKPRKALLVS